MPKLISKNPANDEILATLEVTSHEELPVIFERARVAQKAWEAITPTQRCKYLIQLREVLLNRLDEVIDLISKENGKPHYEAMMSEVFPTVDMLTYFSKRIPKLLKDKSIPLTLMKHRKSYVQYWPIGVVVVISPWNYPFLLPFGNILIALATGNAVIFKPSEVTPCIGLKIQELCEEAGLPPHVLQTVIGDGTLGAQLIDQKPGKIFFTGSVASGKKVMAAAAEHLIPVNLELGGKDAMIVLPDADLDYATSAAVWGGFTNSGQVCASIERIIVHERIAAAFTQKLKEKLATLRQGPSSDRLNDLGPITFPKQKSIYAKQIEEAKLKKAQFITGGTFSEDGRYLQPTIVTGPEIEKMEVFTEETFGPTVAITTFQSISEAIQKANQSKYGLIASVITKNISLGEEIAKRLEVGTVTINEVVYTAGLGETPWGGVKESGFGKTHSELGVYEFVHAKHIHKPRFHFLTFKSFWWFPYSPFQYVAFRKFIELYRKNWVDKLRNFPDFLWNFIQFLKKEPRL